MSKVICFGAAHWDIIARAKPDTAGLDRPGIVETRPGGVALNVATALAAQQVDTLLVAPVGGDDEGARLLSAIRGRGIDPGGLVVRSGRETGRYVAIEEADGGLLHAIADNRILGTMTPERIDFGALSDADIWMVEANLPEKLLTAIAGQTDRPPLIANPVSDAKAGRLTSILPSLSLLYCNRREAEVLCGLPLADATAAAEALRGKGIDRAVVTSGAEKTTDAGPDGTATASPPPLTNGSVTGAGDAFMAGHLAATLAGAAPADALARGFNAVNERDIWYR